MKSYDLNFHISKTTLYVYMVMGGIENFPSRLLKNKIPQYHGILPCSDFTYQSVFY